MGHQGIPCTLLREKSQSEQATYYIIQLFAVLKNGKTMETIKRAVFAKALRGRGENFRMVKLLCMIP